MRLNRMTLIVARSAQWVRNTFAFNRELNELNKMTDFELRDMGISRLDVVALAKNMKERPIGR